MYIVVSKWEMKPGKRDEFKEIGRKMRNFIRQQPGVEYVESVECEDGNALAIIGYKDEPTYRKILEPGGVFERESQKYAIEDYGTWLWSERGEAVDREPSLA